MLSYQNAHIRDFSGGLTDKIVDSAVNTFDELDNFRIDKHKNLRLREGSDIHISNTSINSSMHSLLEDRYGLLYGVTGNSLFYENEAGSLSLADTISSTIDNYSTITNFQWKGFRYLTISKHGLERSHLYNIFKKSAPISGNSTSYEATSIQVGCPHMQAPTSISDSGTGVSRRYAIVYHSESTADAGSGDESIESSYGVPFYSDEIDGGAIPNAEIHNIQVSSSYDDYERNTDIEIYRTTEGDPNTFFLVKTIAGVNGVPVDESPIASVTDTMTDETARSKARFYISEGIVEMEQPPKHTCSCRIGDIAYYGNMEVSGNDDGTHRTYRQYAYHVMQSMIGNPTMVNRLATVEVEDVVTGLSNIGSALIVFTDSKVYRFDGVYNNDGTGGYSRRIISEESGCINHASIVGNGSTVYFCGRTGIYVTDGYKVSKVSVTAKFDITDTYMSRIGDYLGSNPSVPKDIYRTKIVGHYDRNKDCIYWTMCNGSESSNELLVLDLYNLCFSIFKGNNLITGAMLINDNYFLIGDDSADIYKYSSDYGSDAVRISDATAAYKYSHIPFRAKLTSIDFGDPSVKKWVQALTLTISAKAKSAIKAVSYNDNGSAGKDLKSIVLSTILQWRDVNMRWRDPKMLWRVPTTRSFRRHFPKRGMRCRYKQVSIEPAASIQYSSEVFGTVTAAYLDAANPDATEVKFTFDNGTSIWPTDIIDYSIYVDDDNYTVGYKIISFNGSGIIVQGGGISIGSGKLFKIEGIRKNQKFTIENMTMQFAPLTNTGVDYRGGDE